MDNERFYQFHTVRQLKVYNSEKDRFEPVAGACGSYLSDNGRILKIGEDEDHCKVFGINTEKKQLWPLFPGFRNYDCAGSAAFLQKGKSWFLQIKGCPTLKNLSFNANQDVAFKSREFTNGDVQELVVAVPHQKYYELMFFGCQNGDLLLRIKVFQFDMATLVFKKKKVWHRYLGGGRSEVLGHVFRFLGGRKFYFYKESKKSYIMRSFKHPEKSTCYEKVDYWTVPDEVGRLVNDCLLGKRLSGNYDFYANGEKFYCESADDYRRFLAWTINENDTVFFGWNFSEEAYEKIYEGPDSGYFFNAAVVAEGENIVKLLNFEEQGKIVAEGKLILCSQKEIVIGNKRWSVREDQSGYLDWASVEMADFRNNSVPR